MIWMTSIIKCLEEGIWPEDKNEARCLRLKINQYVMKDGVLFRRSYMLPMLRCVGPLQVWPSRIICTDNGTQFMNDLFKSWYARLNIQQMKIVVAHPPANGLVEKASKSLMAGIKTRFGRGQVGDNRLLKLPNVSGHYLHISSKAMEKRNLFSLTYDSEVVIPA
ncbi:reverse transcriptase domain-containing protein [Tanacetum coccineum]|uniref:Reverse transcriptase domain-containing protein n=1 Tax=Tanacetum coccineum TaxID=301880 RepID=A0ABQ5FX88_9ASTR